MHMLVVYHLQEFFFQKSVTVCYFKTLFLLIMSLWIHTLSFWQIGMTYFFKFYLLFCYHSHISTYGLECMVIAIIGCFIRSRFGECFFSNRLIYLLARYQYIVAAFEQNELLSNNMRNLRLREFSGRYLIVISSYTNYIYYGLYK